MALLYVRPKMRHSSVCWQKTLFLQQPVRCCNAEQAKNKDETACLQDTHGTLAGEIFSCICTSLCLGWLEHTFKLAQQQVSQGTVTPQAADAADLSLRSASAMTNPLLLRTSTPRRCSWCAWGVTR